MRAARSTRYAGVPAAAFVVCGLVAGGGTPAGAHDALPSPDVTAFGDAVAHGSTSTVDLAAPVVGMARAPDGTGYWEVASDGGVFSFGTAQFLGSMGGKHLNQPVVGIAATPAGTGYWEVASDGGVFSFGTAQFLGSMGGKHLNQPVVGIAATPAGTGYWEVASDGGVFSFGTAQFLGSMGGKHLNQPVVGIAATPAGTGYWEVASDGGVFSFGTAQFLGSMGGKHLNQPVVGIAATPAGTGYWEVASDGGVFSFGTARYFGSYDGEVGGLPSYMRFVGLAPTLDGGGYWLVASGFCSSPGSLAPASTAGSTAPPVATLWTVTVGPYLGCAEQVDLQFRNPSPSEIGYQARYVTAPVAGASGLPVQMAGTAFLQITVHPAQSNAYSGPVDIVPTNTSNIEEVRQTENFEGYVTWVIGMAHQVPFWVDQLPGGRLVVGVG